MQSASDLRRTDPETVPSRDQIRSHMIERGLLAPGFRLFAVKSSFHQEIDIKTLSDELKDLGGVFSLFGRYLGTRVDIFKLEDCYSLFQAFNSARDRDENIESFFGTEKGHFQVEDGSALVAVRPSNVPESNFDLLSLLKQSFQSFLPDTVEFDRLINEFHRELKAAQDIHATATQIDSIGQSRNVHSSLYPARTIYEPETAVKLIIEQPPGIRLDDYLQQVNSENDPFFDGLESKSGYVPEEIARAICDGWLHLAINCGIVPVDFDERDIVVVSANQVSFIGSTFKELTQGSRDNLRKYLLYSCNDDPAKALQHLQIECDTSNCNNLHDIDRLFRQLVPFRHGGWNDEGSVNSCAETVVAQIRLLSEQGIHLNPSSRELFRGLFCLARIARQLSPIRDSLNEGIKDLRLQSLLENAREILDPIHWTAQTDKMIGLMMLAPKNFDQAIDQFGAESQVDQQSRAKSESKLSDRLILVLVGAVGIFYGIPILSQVVAKFQRVFDQLIGWGG